MILHAHAHEHLKSHISIYLSQTDKNQKGTAYLASLYDHCDLYVTELSAALLV